MSERTGKARNVQADLEKLCSNALSYGAIKAAPISARKIIVDPRVRLKCAIPVCDGYGRASCALPT